MISKRGQVTVFIVVGIILLAAILTLVILRSSIFKEVAEMEEEKAQAAASLEAPVKNYIQSCLRRTGEDALHFVSQQGGYYELPTLSDPEEYLPYYFYEEENHLLSKKELEQQIAAYVDHELFFCLQNFKDFQSYDVEQGKIRTKVIIAEEKVIFEVNFPVTVTQNQISASLVTFTETVPARIGVVYTAADEFMQQQEDDPEFLCLSCLVKLAMEHDLKIHTNDLEEGKILFTIYEEEVGVDNEPLQYQFLNQYGLRER